MTLITRLSSFIRRSLITTWRPVKVCLRVSNWANNTDAPGRARMSD